MKSKVTVLVAALLPFMTGASNSPADVESAYKNSIDKGILDCTVQRLTAVAVYEAKKNGTERYDQPEVVPPNWQACISEQKVRIKSLYESALKVTKKPGAKAALKEHFIQATLSLTGIDPYSDELKLAYNKRQVDNGLKLRELWDRYEIEK